MNILYVYADQPKEWNSSEWRVRMPCDAINRSGLATARMVYVKEFGDYPVAGSEAVSWADVVVIQRLLIEQVAVAALLCMKQNKTVIVDYDDAYHIMPKTVASYSFWHQGRIVSDGREYRLDTLPINQITAYSKFVHAVTTPSKTLCDDWRKYGIKTYCVPNYLETKKYTLKPKKEGRIRIGWGGSHSHLHSFIRSHVPHALERAVKKFDNVDVVILGAVQIANAIKIPKDRIIHKTWTDFNGWLENIQDIDIGVVPLSTDYDKRRSWIKPMEYALTGIPFVASVGVDDITKELPSCEVTFNNPKTWEYLLSKMVREYGLWYEAALVSRKVALTADIDANIHQTINLYKEIREGHNG